jgi:hypothetical protein
VRIRLRQAVPFDKAVLDVQAGICAGLGCVDLDFELTS